MKKLRSINFCTSATDKIRKNGSPFLYRPREAVVLSLTSDKPTGHEASCKFKTIHYKNLNQKFLRNIVLYLEDKMSLDMISMVKL